MRSVCKRIRSGILRKISELMTQEQTAIGSSNLVEEWNMWSAMYAPLTTNQDQKVPIQEQGQKLK